MALAARSEAWWDPDAKSAHCLECSAAPEPDVAPEPDITPEPDVEPEPAAPVTGTAGASARREGERRSARREERIRRRFGRFGGLVLALTDDPQSTRAWGQGAVGEERVGELLDGVAGPLVRVLHDRRMPGSRANIDHIAIAPSGIYAIDAKHYRGKVARRKPLFSREVTLLVAGRDRTRLVAGVQKQVAAVRDAAEGPEGATVAGVLCFVGADWGLFQDPFEVNGVHVMWPKALAKLLAAEGPLDATAIDAVSERLRARLAAA